MPLEPGNRHLLIVIGLRIVTGNQMAPILDQLPTASYRSVLNFSELCGPLWAFEAGETARLAWWHLFVRGPGRRPSNASVESATLATMRQEEPVSKTRQSHNSDGP